MEEAEIITLIRKIIFFNISANRNLDKFLLDINDLKERKELMNQRDQLKVIIGNRFLNKKDIIHKLLADFDEKRKGSINKDDIRRMLE